MSVATSTPCLRVAAGRTTSTSAPSSSTAPTFRLAAGSRSHYAMTVMNSQAEGPLRRPVAPPPPPLTPSPPPKPVAPSPPPQPSGPAAEVGKGVVTVEFQRQKAKEIQEYFKQKKLEEASQGPFFGFLAKNEISNGRWAMFGFAVGMLTEYATGSDFVDQVKILLSNFGILDLE